MSRTSLLERPEAQALLADAAVSAAAVRGCRSRLSRFLVRYLPLFYRAEQRELAEVVIGGKLSNLQRKTSEPIAYQAGRPRKPVQHFVGAGAWDDEAVQAELRRDVAEAWGDPEAVLVFDGSGFPKKGEASCGVARQWCGRLGKVDNCQVGVFLAYVTAHGATLVDRRLYLPEDWARDRKRRKQTHVPKTVRFQEGWRIALDLLDRAATDLPFGWVAGDDEFGRVTELRAALRQRGRRYVLDVPCDTLVRDIDEPPAPGKRSSPWRRADAWRRPSRRRAGGGCAWVTARRGRRRCVWPRRGCRPRTQAAASARWSGWWCCGPSTDSRRRGTRCPMPPVGSRGSGWPRCMASGTASRRRCRRAKAK